MRSDRWVILTLLAVILLTPWKGWSEELHGRWNALLEAHVLDGGVDYLGFKRDEEKLAAYLAQLDAIDPDRLESAERLAFYINAYNAYTVKLILENFQDNRPVASIKKIGGFFSSPWSIRLVRIGGRLLTLDNIEHDIIRPQFRDPRIHFAINCAARSCPPLRGEAYVGERLERQLDDSTAAFLNDPNATFVAGNVLHLSKIFDWFSEDFGDDAASFIARYARGELAAAIKAAGPSLRLKFLPYDWSLNGIETLPAK